jgi:hypothetical protein
VIFTNFLQKLAYFFKKNFWSLFSLIFTNFLQTLVFFFGNLFYDHFLEHKWL